MLTMSSLTETLNIQISKCKELLKIFQNEREFYLEQSAINMEQVMDMLEKKKALVNVFQQQQETLLEIKKSNTIVSPESKGKITQLSELLEQLLIIDQENERLIKEKLNAPGKSVARAARRPVVARTSMQCQMPFVPPTARRPVPVVNVRKQSEKPVVKSRSNDPKRAAVENLLLSELEKHDVRNSKSNRPAVPNVNRRIRQYANSGRTGQLALESI
jgi:flagellar biosynthesis/type III secretory pathway chaperone